MTHGIVEKLLNESAVTALVGQNVDSDTYKIYAAMVPQDERPPYIACRVVDGRPIQCKGTQSNQETDIIQVDCYATSYDACYQLYRTVRSVLDNSSSTLADGTEIDAYIDSVRDLTEREMVISPDVAKRPIYGIISLYRCEVTLGSIT